VVTDLIHCYEDREKRKEEGGEANFPFLCAIVFLSLFRDSMV
jgi:hypothetical protein